MAQIIAAVLAISFGVHIKFIEPRWLAILLTIIWIVGMTNAFNIIDIMDGLASSIAIVASFGFLFISMATEEIYVNFMAVALAGSALGFIPYNLSKRWRIFMGDSGSLLLGFILSTVALGTSYEGASSYWFLTPLILLGLPIYDTFLVFTLRLLRGKSPFLGSKDHFPLRLEALGWTRPHILIVSIFISTFLCLCGYFINSLDFYRGTMILGFLIVLLALFTSYILRVKVK